ncbi:partial Protein RhsD, partial [Anaerolineae bacterium]
MTLSSPRRLNTVGKRLLTIFSVVVFTCVLITLVLQPADTSAQKSEATLTPAATLSDNADTQSKKNATATPASTQQATATPVSTWLPTPTPAGRQTPTPQTESARPPIIRAVESDPDPRGYSDLAATFYTDKYLSQFLLSQAHEAPIDFHLTCVDESPYEGCKLLSEQPYGVGYSVRWQGVLVVPDDGEYTFTLADVDDGARLFLDGTLVTDWSWNWPSSDTLSTPRSVTLSAGEHSIIVDYMQRPPLVASLEVRWSGPTFAEEIIPVADIERIKDRDEDECPLCSDEVQGSVGDPINTYYGNFIYRATDLSLPTVGQSLRIERTYNTLFVTGTKIYTQPLGYGWIHNYNVHLTFPNDPGGEENTVILNARHGSRLRFTIEGSEYIPDPGIQATLISTLDDPKVYTVTAVHQETYVFTATGQLIGYYDTKGNQTAYTYQDEQLSRITDVGSERWLDLGYDDQARLTSVTDPISRSVQYDYDLNGDLSVVTDTRGLAWTYIYTGSHLLSTIIDPDGRTVERTFYDTQARAVRQEDGLGNAIVQLNYAPGGGQRVITEAGKVTTDTYDVEAVLVGRIDAQGHAQDYGFNDNLFRESVSDANGNTTRYARTSLGLTTAITDAQGQVTTMAYDELNNLTEMTDARGVTTSFTYSGTFLTRKTDALGNTWLYTPTTDGRNLLATEEASGGRVTHYEYDAYGQRITVTDTLQNVTRSAYDPIGRLITTTDAAGLLTVHTYDNADHLVAVTRNYTTTSAEQNYLDAYNLITRYQYDGFGRQIAVTDTVGHVMCNFYDGAGRLVSTTVNYSPTVGPNDQNLYNFTTFYGYDTAGRQILVTDTLGTATRTEYDNLSRPITVTQNYQNGIFDPLHPDEDLASVTHYDAVGNPIEQIDPAGRLTRTYYDSLNRVISTTANYTTTTSEPGYLNLYNLTTWNEYDEVGRQVAITDTQGRVTHNYYDALGRAISTTQNYRPDVEPNYLGQYNLTTLNEYNLLGQRVAMTDALSQPTRYTYDVMGRVVQTENALGGTTETGYDSLGRRSVVTDALQHTTIYTYDAIGRLSQTQDAGGNVTTYGYDVLGRTIVVTDPLDHATRT